MSRISEILNNEFGVKKPQEVQVVDPPQSALHPLAGETVWVLNCDFNNAGTWTMVFPSLELAQRQICLTLFKEFDKDYKRSVVDFADWDEVELPPFPEKWEDVTMDHVEAFFQLDGNENWYWIHEVVIAGEVKPSA